MPAIDYVVKKKETWVVIRRERTSLSGSDEIVAEFADERRAEDFAIELEQLLPDQ